MNKETFCILAEKGLHLHNTGQCNSCSDSSDYWKNDKGEFYSIADTSLDEIWNSKSRKVFLEQLHSGIKHSNCQKCWTKENAGIKSKRQISNETWLHYQKDTCETPLFIDLKWGNVCNLKCRHCNPWTSSKWVNEWFLVDQHQTNQQAYYASLKNITRSYHLENKENFHNIFRIWLKSCKHIKLYGGEGMYVKDVFDIFKSLAESGDAKNISLYINTNGTIYNLDWIKVLAEFRKVEMVFSIDAVQDQFEYIRYGAEWQEVVSNFKKYSNLPRSSVMIVTTIFSLNIFNALEIIAHIANKLDKIPFVNFVYGPDWWDIRNLPSSVKEKIYKRNQEIFENLNDTLHPRFRHEFKQSYNDIQNFLKDNVEPNIQKFQEMSYWIKSIDTKRNQKFNEFFKDYNELLKIY